MKKKEKLLLKKVAIVLGIIFIIYLISTNVFNLPFFSISTGGASPFSYGGAGSSGGLI